MKDEMIKTIYYYYFLFYCKILNDKEPHLLTTLALSASESFLVNGVLQIFLAKYFCISIGKWPMLGVLSFSLVLNYIYFHNYGNAKEIVKSKPRFFSSNRVSITLALLFFIVTISFLFWGPVLVKQIVKTNCK